MEILRDENFVRFAMKHYDNRNCESVEEFQEDLKHFKYLKRLVNRYADTGELKERLILNHITIIYNLFGSEAATKMLFLKMRGLETYIKPFLILLNQMPETIDVMGKTIRDTDIDMDSGIVEALRRI